MRQISIKDIPMAIAIISLRIESVIPLRIEIKVDTAGLIAFDSPFCITGSIEAFLFGATCPFNCSRYSLRGNAPFDSYILFLFYAELLW